MKKLLSLIAFISLISCSQVTNENSKSIELSGKVEFPDNRFKMKIFRYTAKGKEIVDSFALNSDNTYKHTFKNFEPGVYNLDVQLWQTAIFWAEDENISIDFRGQDTSKYKMKMPTFHHLKGGKLNDFLNSINSLNVNSSLAQIEFGQQIYKAVEGDMDLYSKAVNPFYDISYDELDRNVKFLIDQNKDHVKSVVYGLKLLSADKDYDYIINVISDLENKFGAYPALTEFKETSLKSAEAKKRNAIGNVASPFKYKDVNGNEVSLESYKGKYLLIDFWASWCGPCREEIPNLKKVYELYSSKGLEFLSISIDKDLKAWKKAMDEEQMPWTQLCTDDAGVKLMEDYYFSGIPYIVLLDKESKFVGKNLRGKNLEEKLEEIFSN